MKIGVYPGKFGMESPFPTFGNPGVHILLFVLFVYMGQDKIEANDSLNVALNSFVASEVFGMFSSSLQLMIIELNKLNNTVSVKKTVSFVAFSMVRWFTLIK